jgi:hypothetical protein
MATKEKFPTDPVDNNGNPYVGVNGTPADTNVITWSAANSRAQWGTASGGGGGTISGTDPSTCQGRLTLESGVPVSTSDQTGKTTIYWTPYKGSTIALYSGSAWSGLQVAETSLALGTLTSGKNYDVFGYSNSGTFTLELSAAWTSDTARNDALALQDGVRVKSADHTRRYLGTFRTTSTTTTESSLAKRFLWNEYNQVPLPMKNVDETTDSWNYTTATYRQANANSANQLDYVTGDASTLVEAEVYALVANTTAASVNAGVGVDSTSTNSAQRRGSNTPAVTNAVAYTGALYKGYPGLGRHFLAWLEYSTATGTTTWFGDAAGFQCGISGRIMG